MTQTMGADDDGDDDDGTLTAFAFVVHTENNDVRNTRACFYASVRVCACAKAYLHAYIV